jgi:hypothetical protein
MIIKNKYYGITHFIYPLFQYDIIYKFWKRFFCKRNLHLLDEVLSYCEISPKHYLVCDACGLIIYIDYIDTQYIKEKNEHI